MTDCGSRNPAGSTAEGDDDRLAGGPVRVEPGDDRRRIGELGGTDFDALGGSPAVGRLGPGCDDHPPAELGRRLREMRHCRGSRPVSSR